MSELRESVVSVEISELPEAEVAFETTRAAREALPGDQVKAWRMAMGPVIVNTMAVAEAYAVDRQRFAEYFNPSKFDPSDYDDLPVRLSALCHVDGTIRFAETAHTLPEVQRAVAEAEPLFAKLKRAALYLWADDPEVQAAVVLSAGQKVHVHLAEGLFRLRGVFKAHAGGYVGRCDVSVEDVKLAEKLALHLGRVGRLQQNLPSTLEKLREERDRAGTLLLQGVRTVRRHAEVIFDDDPVELLRYPRLGNNNDLLKPAKAKAEEVEGKGDGKAVTPTPAAAPVAATEVTPAVTPAVAPVATGAAPAAPSVPGSGEAPAS